MSFRLKIVLGLVVILILLMVLLVWSSLNFLRISNEVELSNRAASTASILAATLASTVAAGDADALAATVNDVLAQPDIVYIRVISHDETLVSAGDPAILARPFAEDFLFEDVTDGIYDVSAEIRIGGIPIGRVEIGLSTTEVSDMMAAARREMATIAVIGLGLSILFSLMLGNHFARQLTRLKDATRRIASGDIGYQLAVAGNDELAQTANAFNTMSRKLAMLYSEKQSALNRARQKADELLDSERRIHAVLDHAIDAIFTFDEGGVIESFNPAGERIFGCQDDDCIGQDIGVLIPEPWLSEQRASIREFLRGAGARAFGATREIEGLRKDGSVFPLEIDISEVDIEGRHLFIAIARDITARKQTELELRRAQAAALESSRNKFEFIANISQEIRAPVNEMLGSLNVLAESDLASDQRTRVGNIQASGNSLITIINDMLDFSRIEAGKLQLEVIDFDLWRTVDTVYRLFRDAAEGKGVHLAYILPCPVPTALRGDPTRLRQLLINLIDNALKFTDKGEVILRVSVIDEEAEHAELRFEVADTGIGIAPAVQQRIFEIFAHSELPLSSPRSRSSGLGLMISKRLAEMMQGTIGVGSEIGRGSVFWFTARFGKQTGAVTAPESPSGDLSQLRILIVNPDRDACGSLRAMIDESGLRSRCIEDGMKALNELGAAAGRGRPYDLVIFDREIPGMNGLQFAHAVRGDKRFDQTRMIMIAATGYRGDGEEVRQAGIQGYLTAPFEREQVHACIVDVMQGERDGREVLVTRYTLESRPGRQQQDHALVVSADQDRQKHLLGRLERLGYRASLATDSAEALASTEHNAWRLVVVDNETRELLGADALRKIRRREQDGHEHIPVAVIVSPAASRNERQFYRSAGADECLTGMAGIDELKLRITGGA
jgi:PAS domain S-box-containing protein